MHNAALRRLDALVGEHVMGLEVMPEFLPAELDVNGVWHIDPSSTSYPLHPVHLEHCVHEGWREAQAKLAQQWQEEGVITEEDVREYLEDDDALWAFGHYYQCLDVVPLYTSSLLDDYSVLEKVRGWKERGVRECFERELRARWSKRRVRADSAFSVNELAVLYMPGDYSFAALAALNLGGDTCGQ